VAVGVEIRAQSVQKSVQLCRTAAVPYTVNHVVDIWAWACDASFGAFGAFSSPLITLRSQSFPVGRHPFPFEFLFGYPLGLIFQQHFQNQPVLSCNV
jgi:hypothetical protein